jgi:heat shock protein HtpX
MATVNTAWDKVSQNIFKTYLIMALFTIFAVGVIYVIGKAWFGSEVSGLSIVGFALIFSGIMNFVSYFYSDKIVLATAGAKPVLENSDVQFGELTSKQLYRLVENLCIAAGLPTPRIFVIEDSAPNAFATGRDPKHAVICFTTGILGKLNKQELEGVAGHELSHVGNRDTLLMSVVAILVGTIALVADWFLRSMFWGGRGGDREGKNNTIFLVLGIIFAILAPLVGTLIQLAISRRREYLADASGVLLTRYPEGLEKALIKISGDQEPLEAANRGTAHLYIVNPLKGKDAAGFFVNLFNTHPPMKDRIKALQEMEGKI